MRFSTRSFFWMGFITLTPISIKAESLHSPAHRAAHSVSLGDVRIHHQLYEAPAAATEVTLVLIHGWSCDARYWDAQLADLVARHPVLTVDLAGHGRSEGRRDDLSMRAFGTDVARAVQDAVPTGSLILIGHSMGGPVAIETALQLGSRVRGIIGVDTFKNIGAPPPDPQQTEARLQFFANDFAAATQIFVSQTFFRDDADPALKARIAADMAAGDPAVGIAAIRALNEWDGVKALQQLEQGTEVAPPVLAINARHGAPTELERLRGLYSDFQLLEMDGVGHFLMMEQPEAFNDILLQEIARLTGFSPTSRD